MQLHDLGHNNFHPASAQLRREGYALMLAASLLAGCSQGPDLSHDDSSGVIKSIDANTFMMEFCTESGTEALPVAGGVIEVLTIEHLNEHAATKDPVTVQTTTGDDGREIVVWILDAPSQPRLPQC